MKTHPARTLRFPCFVAFAALILTGSLAGAADYYAGKTITIVCPYSTGGTYDRMSRLAAKFLPRHIPGNPAAIVNNKPGAGGVIGLRSVYKAKPDGLSLIHFTSPMVVRSLTGGIQDIDFKKLTWLGSVGGAHYIFALRSDRPERTIKDFQTTKKAIRVGASGPSSLLTQAPKFLQRAGKFNLRLVPGYKGYNPMALAMKQNEVDAVSTAGVAIRVNTATREMHKDGTIKLVLSMGGAPPPDSLKAEVAALPKFVDGIADPKDRDAWVAFSGLLSASRPFAATPGLPADRAAILKKAMADMMADPEFRKTATDQGFVLNTLNAQEAETLILSVFNLSSDIQDRLKALLK